MSALALTSLVGCDSAMRTIDRRTEATLLSAADDVSGGTIAPRLRTDALYEGDPMAPDYPERYRPPTRNPSASDLRFTPQPPRDETLEAAAARIQAEGMPPADAVELDLRGAIRFAIDNAVEYLNAEETYIIVALALIVEQHRWEPRPFNVTSAEFAALGNDGRFGRTLQISNDLGVTQRLPYGGEVSARLVVDVTRQVDGFFTQEGTAQSADLILQAEIPFSKT